MIISDISIEERRACAVAWQKGVKHKFYEDSFRILSLDIPIVKNSGYGELFGVFDGIGSAPQGRRAAQELSDGLLDFFKKKSDDFSLDMRVQNLLLDKNKFIYGWGTDNTNKPIGGAVGTVLRVYDEQAEISHAGDTRGILFSEGNGKFLTSLHQAEDGAVTRFFGMGANLKIQTTKHKLEDGDRILLCSDGITGVLGLDEILEIEETYLSNKEIALNLVERAIKRGTRDDVTALVYEMNFD